MNLGKFFDLLPWEVIEKKFKNINVKSIKTNIDYIVDNVWNYPDDDRIFVSSTSLSSRRVNKNIRDNKLEINDRIAIKFVLERL